MRISREFYDSTVEIGHTYAPELPAEFHDQWRQEHGLELPVFAPPSTSQDRVRWIAECISRRPYIVSMVDDLSVSDKNARFMTELSVGEAFNPDDVHRESDYIDPARALVERVREMSLPEGYRINEHGSKLVMGSGKNRKSISLTGYDGIEDPTHPSCEMLDAAWTLYRLQTWAPQGINILPLGFRPQQERVREIARLLPEFQGYKFKSMFTREDGWVVGAALNWNLDDTPSHA